MLVVDFIVIVFLTLLIMLTIIYGEKIDLFFRIVGFAFKDVFLKKNVPVVQGETQEQKQARFNTGKVAGDELYAEGR